MRIVACLICLFFSMSVFAGDSPRYRRVLTKTQQDKLTPDEVLKRLKAGNARYLANENTVRDHKTQVRKAVRGQFPKAIVLSCVDSRVPVEDVFDQGIGDIFVARVAGNFVNKDILGSMEFATKVAGSKLVLVLGHENCGAVKAAVDNVQVGNITSLVDKIQPAVAMSAKKGEKKTSKNANLVKRVCHNNVKYNVSKVREDSEIIRKLEKEGKVKVVGAVYDISTGKVNFMDYNYTAAH